MTELTVTFPTRFRRSQFRAVPGNQIREVQKSIVGTESVVPTFATKWDFSGRISVLEENERLEWLAFVSDMQGGLGVTDLPVYAEYRPLDALGRELPRKGLPDIDVFEHWSFETSTQEFVTLAADVVAGQTEVSLTLADCQGMRPGHYFSIGSRLHIVTKSWSDGSQIRCSPPLRDAHSAGDTVEVANPVCRVRMIGEGNGVPTVELRPIDFVDPIFSEAF